MIDERRAAAIRLRQKGKSIKAIAKDLNAAQSSVSLWVRQVTLTDIQTRNLRANTHSPETIEKRRQSRLRSEQAKRMKVFNLAKSDVASISKRELWLIGTALYWAEGGKTKSVVRFSNGDPNMIQLMIKYFREICNVDESKVRCHIHIHEHLDVVSAEKYWQSVTGIAREKFYKTYNKRNKSSKGTRNSLPNGVCDIYVLDAKLLQKIMGWVQGIYESSI